MSFLEPAALWWLAGVPVLVWLGRLAATRRQWKVPSLVPFEHLLARASLRRRLLSVNPLFCLQLVALLLLAVALAQPVVERPRGRTVLAVLDTSASMGAGDAFDRARRLLRDRLARLGARDQVLLITTAPIPPVTLTAIPAAEALLRLVDLDVAQISGNLGTAVQIGAALLNGVVDDVWVATDEPKPPGPTLRAYGSIEPEAVATIDPLGRRPSGPTGEGMAPLGRRPAGPLSDRVTFLTVGTVLPNTAIVGLDAQGPLCAQEPARLGVTVENFWQAPVDLQLTVTQDGRRLTAQSVELEASQRRRIELVLDPPPEGWVEVAVRSRRDALDADDRALTAIRRPSALPIVIRSSREETRRVLGQWLDACEGVVWTDGPAPAAPHLVITDASVCPGGADGSDELMSPHAEGLLRLVGSGPQGPVRLAHWMVEQSHPIASYLSPLEAVAASWSSSAGAVSGEPVVWGLAGGGRQPLGVAGGGDGRKAVTFVIDPVRSPPSTPLVIAFFNSLQWLASQSDVSRTGDPLIIPSLDLRPLTVRRPDGRTEHFLHAGGPFRYDATIVAGRYEVGGTGTGRARGGDFLDPVESNLFTRASTWRSAPTSASA